MLTVIIDFQITKAEEAIQDCYKRVQVLENIIAEKGSCIQDDAKRELAEVRKLLSTNEQLLSSLHKHNRKSFVFAAGLCFVVFFVYMLYILISANDF